MSRPLSIGIVCFPSFGGSGVVASELAAGLAERGHRVHLLATARPGRPVHQWQGVAFHRIDVPAYPLFEHAPYDLAVASKIYDVATEQGLDLIHVHYAVPHAASAILARTLLGPRAPAVIATLHGTDVTRVGADPAYRSIVGAAVAAADGVTVPSDFLRREAYRYLMLPAELPIEVVPNFVDTDRFAPAAQRSRSRFEPLFGGPVDGPVLFHVSNFRTVKRPGDLVDVLVRVRRELPARLVLVGEGPERIEVERRVRALGLQACVAFLGKRADFGDLLRHADAFVLPSESESFGVAAAEALSCGVPVFAYRVGGLPEVVPPQAGRLVEPSDVDALARAVIEVVRDPALVEELGAAARIHVLERYRREPALDRYETYYRRVLAAAAGRT